MNVNQIATCVLAVLALAGCERARTAAPDGQAPGAADMRPRVRVCSPALRTFSDTASVQGTVRAKTTAAVAARVPGVIDALLAAEGEKVESGAPLFQVDRVNLENAVRAAEDDIRLAKASIAQAEAADEKARTDLARMERLAKAGAITVDAAEKAQLGAKSSSAQLLAAKAQLAKAETGLQVAKKNLADSKVCAPFAGTITRKMKDVGDYAAPGVPVFLMEDNESCEVRFALDASRYAAIKEGKTQIGDGKVAWKSPTVDPATRTFEVRTVVPRSDTIRPGMLVTAKVVFSSFDAPALPASAVNPMPDGKSAVFAVEGGKVVRRNVTVRAESDGWCAIGEGELKPGVKVVAEGMLLLHEGDEVSIMEE